MNKRVTLRTAALILLATACAACGPQRLRVALPPAELAICADEPLAPDLPADQTERDRLTLDYILGLRSAWGDCKSKVDGLRAWMERVQ